MGADVLARQVARASASRQGISNHDIDYGEPN